MNDNDGWNIRMQQDLIVHVACDAAAFLSCTGNMTRTTCHVLKSLLFAPKELISPCKEPHLFAALAPVITAIRQLCAMLTRRV